MADKVAVYNIALDALLINYQTTDPDNDTRKEVRSLNTMYPLALSKVLTDLDLNRTATKVHLEQLANAYSPHWKFIYKYPSNAASIRRLVSPMRVDNRETRIPFATEYISNQSVIVTNQPNAWAEIIRLDVSIGSLNPNAVVALGYYLAFMASSLITGKGARDLKRQIFEEYKAMKAEAQEDDQNENVDTTPDEFQSDFVQARIGGNRRWLSRT